MDQFRSFLKVFWRVAFVAIIPGGAVLVLWHDRRKIKQAVLVIWQDPQRIKRLAAEAKKNVVVRFARQKAA